MGPLHRQTIVNSVSWIALREVSDVLLLVLRCIFGLSCPLPNFHCSVGALCGSALVSFSLLLSRAPTFFPVVHIIHLNHLLQAFNKQCFGFVLFPYPQLISDMLLAQL